MEWWYSLPWNGGTVWCGISSIVLSNKVLECRGRTKMALPRNSKILNMEKFVLKIKDIELLNEIRDTILQGDQLTGEQKKILTDFLSGLPKSNDLLSIDNSIEAEITINLLNAGNVGDALPKWTKLFVKLPGSEVCVPGEMLPRRVKERNKIALAIAFAPSFEYRRKDKLFDLYLFYDGSAKIIMKYIKDAEDFPDLYSFKGNWEESYYLLIDTMKKGWPQQDFPKELQRFLSES
jgi:hypothetical protein